MIEENIEVTDKDGDVVDVQENQEQPVDVMVEEPVEEGMEMQQEEEKEEDFFENIAESMDDRDLSHLAKDLISDYKRDKESRSDWEKSYINGLDLLGFKYKDEGQPFKGASSVTHPLLAEAVTQFQAQAYKELLPAEGPVKTMVVGEKNIQRTMQANRVKEFMNYMILNQMEEYTPDFDQLLFYLPLAGSAFKKIYYDDTMKRAVSKFVAAEDLVVPYYVTNLYECERITHLVKMSENDVLKNKISIMK